jgi:hypothetical protein
MFQFSIPSGQGRQLPALEQSDALHAAVPFAEGIATAPVFCSKKAMRVKRVKI